MSKRVLLVLWVVQMLPENVTDLTPQRLEDWNDPSHTLQTKLYTKNLYMCRVGIPKSYFFPYTSIVADWLKLIDTSRIERCDKFKALLTIEDHHRYLFDLVKSYLIRAIRHIGKI